MPVDKLLIKQRLALISQYLDELDKLASLSKKEFLETRNAASAESFLRRSLESIFDIGRHILAREGGINIALEYKGIARGLHERGIISSDLSEQLVKMAGYRNRLVHLYYQISDEELHEIVKNNLEDIRLFKKQILSFISHRN
jgi:uncharacterized protein YutE (UPF0331/DUF86 family)